MMSRVTDIKVEPTGVLAGFVNLDGSPKYPGIQVLTWLKPPGMPWMLAEIEPLPPNVPAAPIGAV